jgi:hypothetical protein
VLKTARSVVNGGLRLIPFGDNKAKDCLGSRRDVKHVKCRRHATSPVSTGGLRDPHNSGIGLHIPVTDCRGGSVAKRGMSVVASSCFVRAAYSVDPRLSEHLDV